jgi:hypothetical protein
MGYVQLLLAGFDDVCFNITYKARSSELTNGDCYLAWQGHKHTFVSTTLASKVSLKKKFSQSKHVDPNKDPMGGITKLA